ncbi:MAG: glycosyltransferase, partial [Chthoniobacterales bacterium]
FYPDVSQLRAGLTTQMAAEESDGSIDILLIDDCDRGEILQRELQAWRSKLAPQAVILFHGLNLERADSPRAAWREVAKNETTAEFSPGLGLGILALDAKADFSPRLPNESNDVANLYGAVAARIDAQAGANKSQRENSALRLRQVWFDTVLADRAKAQQIMDDQAGQLTGLRAHATDLQQVLDDRARKLEQSLHDFDQMRRDRAKAQLVIDAQAERLRDTSELDALRVENETIKAELSAKKRVLKMAKAACRKNGRCFQVPSEKKDKPRRSIPEKIIRELKRIPANLRGKKKQPLAKPAAKVAKKIEGDRYAEWITKHEPDAAALEEQRVAAAGLTSRAKISLLLLIHDTPRAFLEELFASLAAQTYDNFEICAVDAASSRPETIECVKEWQRKEPRLRLEILPQNFGIAENTNRALALASGDFVVCIDHDDLVAPFALYELARAMAQSPKGEIFYSDEDRLSVEGKRHSPFFKPDWNPELLLSFMYLGHLTAYRRELVERVGQFRKEFDLSQDYDFALRATELAHEIVHVPYVLYHWREHPASGSAGGKPHARKTNLAALHDAMKRRGLAAEIIEHPTANRVRFQISRWPRVSIVVPTDSATRAKACLEELPRMTAYQDLEIVLVTNSLLIEALESLTSGRSGFRFVRYDKPFNFSEKCNLGAAAASGARLIFLNDDVASLEPDWIQNLIEPLENPEIGAVAPKLLYATGKIQHAGLVTGVRDLVGTACHQWPGDSTDYFNFAQSMRDVS